MVQSIDKERVMGTIKHEKSHIFFSTNLFLFCFFCQFTKHIWFQISYFHITHRHFSPYIIFFNYYISTNISDPKESPGTAWAPRLLGVRFSLCSFDTQICIDCQPID